MVALVALHIGAGPIWLADLQCVGLVAENVADPGAKYGLANAKKC